MTWPCQTSLLAEDCAIEHWCSALRGRSEKTDRGQVVWRADCPYPGCGADRALEWDVPTGRGIRHKSWCSRHDKDALRPVLLGLLPGCFPRSRADRVPVDRDDLAALALSGLPPQTMKLEMLRLAGYSTAEALDKLGVRLDHRARVIAGKTGGRAQMGEEYQVSNSPKWASQAAPGRREKRPNGRGIPGQGRS